MKYKNTHGSSSILMNCQFQLLNFRIWWYTFGYRESIVDNCFSVCSPVESKSECCANNRNDQHLESFCSIRMNKNVLQTATTTAFAICNNYNNTNIIRLSSFFVCIVLSLYVLLLICDAAAVFYRCYCFIQMPFQRERNYSHTLNHWNMKIK